MTQAFNLSQFANKVNSSGLADLTTAVTGTLPVANGGTNQTTYTNGQLLIGNTTGNTLTKSTLTAGSGVTITNGSGAITIAAAAGQIQNELFVGPGTWTCPAYTTQVKVTVIGGGGSSAGPGTGGGTSSFGPFVSATGGSTPSPSVYGAGTVSTGTALKTGSISTSTTQPTLLSYIVSFGSIWGRAVSLTPALGAGVAYSTSSINCAGAGGIGPSGTNGRQGGFAIAMVPVSSPVTITVGSGGANPNSPTLGPGTGGAVLVEWIS